MATKRTFKDMLKEKKQPAPGGSVFNDKPKKKTGKRPYK